MTTLRPYLLHSEYVRKTVSLGCGIRWKWKDVIDFSRMTSHMTFHNSNIGYITSSNIDKHNCKIRNNLSVSKTLRFTRKPFSHIRNCFSPTFNNVAPVLSKSPTLLPHHQGSTRSISNMAAPGIKLTWQVTKEQIEKDTDELMKRVKTVHDDIGALTDEQVTYENVVKVCLMIDQKLFSQTFSWIGLFSSILVFTVLLIDIILYFWPFAKLLEEGFIINKMWVC